MIVAFSTVVLLVFSGYSILRTYKRRLWLSCMAGMMIAMTIGMIASIAFGTIAGVVYQPDLTSPTVAAVLFGMVCGYLSGKPVSVMAALDGILAGIMGGMMGAMLGVMATNHPNVILLFVDIVMVFVFLVLQQLITEEAVPPQPASTTSTVSAVSTAEADKLPELHKPKYSLLHPLVFGIGIAAIASVFLFQNSGDRANNQKETDIHEHSSVR
ncbi:hypothetical protein ACFPYJ_07235 [Paenibacillus solisilvae]|uniref:DUF4203 domain-containing protein n=1 Tax=Paenibacillus solisilvae TaxID=2486751 RepID=A0ABW0VTZ4_9BACL